MNRYSVKLGDIVMAKTMSLNAIQSDKGHKGRSILRHYYRRAVISYIHPKRRFFNCDFGDYTRSFSGGEDDVFSVKEWKKIRRNNDNKRVYRVMPPSAKLIEKLHGGGKTK